MGWFGPTYSEALNTAGGARQSRQPWEQLYPVEIRTKNIDRGESLRRRRRAIAWFVGGAALGIGASVLGAHVAYKAESVALGAVVNVASSYGASKLLEAVGSSNNPTYRMYGRAGLFAGSIVGAAWYSDYWMDAAKNSILWNLSQGNYGTAAYLVARDVGRVSWWAASSVGNYLVPPITTAQASQLSTEFWTNYWKSGWGVGGM